MRCTLERIFIANAIGSNTRGVSPVYYTQSKTPVLTHGIPEHVKSTKTFSKPLLNIQF